MFRFNGNSFLVHKYKSHENLLFEVEFEFRVEDVHMNDQAALLMRMPLTEDLAGNLFA